MLESYHGPEVQRAPSWPERVFREIFREIWPFFTGAKFLRNLGVIWVQKYFAEISFLFRKNFAKISRNFVKPGNVSEISRNIDEI